METKTMILLVAAALLLILALSLFLAGVINTGEPSGTKIVQETEQPADTEALSSLETEWTRESEGVEIGEMV